MTAPAAGEGEDGMFAAALARVPRGVPRVHHGRDAAGLDCVGLFFLLYRLAGRPVDEVDGDYPPADEMTNADVERFVSRCLGRFEVLPPRGYHADRLVPGDVIVMRGDRRGTDNHVGVYVGGRRVATMTNRLRAVPASRVMPWARWVLRLRPTTTTNPGD